MLTRTIRTDVLALPRVHDAAAVAAIVLLALGAFAPWWAGGRLLAPLDILHETFAPWHDGDVQVDVHNPFTSDAVTQYLGYRAFAARSFAQDGRIGWSDLTHGGRPEYANTMATYDDWTMQLHRFLDFWTAWHLGLLLQLVIAACGMYVLLRSQRIAPPIALVGAIAFAASTPIVHTLYHRWHLGSFAWVPWATWALLQHHARRRWGVAAGAVFIALALLGGSLQTSVFVALTLFGVWLGVLLELDTTPARLRWTRHVATTAVLGVALAAFSLVPALLTYLDGVALHGERSALGYPHGWRQPLLSLLFIPLQAVPTLLGSPRSLDMARAFDLNLTNIAFFGFLPTIIAFLAAFRARTPAAARILIVIGLLLPLTPLVGPLYHRVQIVFVFGGVWAFAHYWQHAPPATQRVWRVVLRTLLACAALWLLASIMVAAFDERARALIQAYVSEIVAAGGAGQLAGFTMWMQQRAGRLVTELMIWHPRQLIALTGIGFSAAALWLRQRARMQAATYVLLCAVVIELAGMSASFLTYADAQRYPPFPVRDDIELLRDEVRDGRVHVVTRYSGPALLFPPNTLAQYGVATLQQFETVDMPGMWHAADSATDARTLGRLGVTHAVAARAAAPADGWHPVLAAATFQLWRNAFALPRYIAVPPGQTLAAYLDGLQRGVNSAASVRVDSATPNRRVLLVPPNTAQLRVADNWSEGWLYRADAGDTRSVQRSADGSMVLALDIVANGSRVEMWYRPQRRKVGWAISLLSALLLVPVSIVSARAPRTRVS